MSQIFDYISRYRTLTKEKKGDNEVDTTLNIAVLASSTIQGMKEVLSVKCHELGITPNIYIADYNQYAQEILNGKSGLYISNPDIVFLFVDTRAILGEQYLLSSTISSAKRKTWVLEKHVEIVKLIGKLEHTLSAKIVMHNFEIPTHSPLGILENKEAFGLRESIQELNKKLQRTFRRNSQVFILEYELFSSRIGKEVLHNEKMYYLADFIIHPQYIPALADEYLAYIKPLTSKTKKCIILDLDNTLWGGIVGEEGLKGLQLGPTLEGRPFLEFQQYLLSLFNRGVLLAINSRNNADDALEVLRKHPYMVLREENFASIQINWDDKVANSIAIAEEIGIGLGSMVFIDDDPVNRDILRNALPEILVIDLPKDPALYVRTLLYMTDFNTLQLTREDTKKGKMYVGQRKRKEFQNTSADLSEYLRGLRMKVIVGEVQEHDIPRIAQLTQKTNQFNLTTKRYTEENIEQYIKKGHLIIKVAVRDKFGDSGIIGVAIVERDGDVWNINTFLLSCRVIGRDIEKVLLGYVLERAKKAKSVKVIGVFDTTKKNKLVKDFYKMNNFSLKKKKKEGTIWEYDVTDTFIYPDFITVIKG